MNQKSSSTRVHYFILMGLVGLHLGTRLYNLMALPIFNDETIYLRMAQLVRSGHWLVTFEYEGRKPLLVWLLALLWPLAKDPLVVARVFSVVVGLATLVHLFLFTERRHGLRAATTAGAFYLLVPFTLFHERLGLYDSLAMLLAWGSFAAASELASERNRRPVLLFGLCTGLGLINKELAYFCLAFPVAMIAASWWNRQSMAGMRLWRRTAMGWGIALAILLVVISAPLAEYGRGFFHTAGYLIDARQSRGLPFGQWATNTRQISAIYWTYLGPALIGLALAHCGLGLWRKSVSGLAAGLCWLGPTAALLLVSQRYYSRYFLFLAPIIVYSAALMLNEKILPLIRRAKSSLAAAAIVAALLAVAPTFPLFWRTLTNPLVADLWPPDRDQYVEGWQSGFGSAAVLQTLRDEARNGRIAVFVAAYAGLYKDLLQLYLSGEPKIEIRVAPWAEQKPLLYFYDRDHPVALAWEPYLPLSPPVWRTAAPLERALFVIDPPQIRLGRFLALNPQARPIFSVYKPGRRSMAAILELPLPGK